ncbi:MAG: glycosyltransferase family 4 protein [Salinivirgaceae bacterium]|nr:glycosyltransferase family 4 protein [Salinivirgaceae bacterium]
MIYLIALLSSIGLTYLVRQLALKKNIIDKPNERSSHTIPTPRGGGLAIVIVWFTGLAYLFWIGQLEQNLFFALLAGLVLAMVSLLDDIFDLKPLIRVFAQSISAIGALYFLGGIHLFPGIYSQSLFWVLNLGAFIGIIWFINLYNFLDGIDGYVSQEAILVAAGMLLIIGNFSLGLLIASVAGFLVWNWPKAKIFMGDVGSTQLGFVLVVLGIYFHNTYEFNVANWLLLTSLFWFDATLTLYRRWRNKERLSVAHRKHAYQRLAQGGFSHLKVDLLAIGMNVFLIGLVLLNHYYLKQGIVLLLIVIGVLFLINSRIDKIFQFKKD